VIDTFSVVVVDSSKELIVVVVVGVTVVEAETVAL